MKGKKNQAVCILNMDPKPDMNFIDKSLFLNITISQGFDNYIISKSVITRHLNDK